MINLVVLILWYLTNWTSRYCWSKFKKTSNVSCIRMEVAYWILFEISKLEHFYLLQRIWKLYITQPHHMHIVLLLLCGSNSMVYCFTYFQRLTVLNTVNWRNGDPTYTLGGIDSLNKLWRSIFCFHKTKTHIVSETKFYLVLSYDLLSSIYLVLMWTLFS